VLAAAAAEPDRLVIGVDASASAMAEASRKAARRPGRGGLPNALFVVAAAEALPPELDGLAGRLCVHFPWGSLLRGLLGADPALLTGLARLLRPGGTLSLLVSSTTRDRRAGVAPLGEADLRGLAGAYADQGLAITKVRPATPADVAAAHSTWGKRLDAGRRRPAWLVEARRSSPSPHEGPRRGNVPAGAVGRPPLSTGPGRPPLATAPEHLPLATAPGRPTPSTAPGQPTPSTAPGQPTPSTGPAGAGRLAGGGRPRP
jgi:16S rRNA (adenine(1408)-N(1))-methyltransferase